MPAPDITLDDIRLRSTERADMVDSPFVTEDELDRYAREAFLELQLRLVARFEDFFLTKTSATLTVGEAYRLPTDFLKFRGMRHTVGTKEFLRRVDLKELPFLTVTENTGRPLHYYVRGDFGEAQVLLELFPAPSTALVMELYYTPLRSLDDVVAGSLRFVAGWGEYVILSVAIKLKDKEESDVSTLLAERAMLYEAMEKSMTPLDASEPFAVVQASRGPAYDPYGDPFAYEDYFG